MDIEMINKLEDIPKKKQHTVARGQYVNMLKLLMSSDNPAMVIHCDSVDDAIKKNIGLYNASTIHKIAVKVWRNCADVYVQKKEEDKNEC